MPDLLYAPPQPAEARPAVAPDRVAATAQSAGALVLRAVRARWLQIAATAVMAVALVLLAVLRAPRTYTVRASFSTESRRGPSSQLAGIAAQFGFGGGEGAASPAFYVDLAKSPVVLARVADAAYVVEDGRRGTYADVTGIGGLPPADRRVVTLRDLGNQIVAAVSPRTGVIRLTVTTQSALLSKQLADTVLAALNEFNLRRRQSQAGEERRFVERRMAEARADLRTAEERLRAFLASNRVYQTSPELALESDRLQREVAFRQSLLTTLAQSYEVVRVDEIRDTPVIAVVEPPEPPLLPDPRRPWALFILAGFAGTTLGLALAVWRTHVADRRAVRPATRGH